MDIKHLQKMKILQKAREFAENDLLNESLVEDLLKAELQDIHNDNKEHIARFLNELIASKKEAMLSK